MAASGPLAVPASPASSSSKRSRSRDSISGNHHHHNHHNHHNHLFSSSSQSAPSLIIPDPSSTSTTPEQPPPSDPTPYPTFLRLSKPDLHQKFVDLEWEQRQRQLQSVHNGAQHTQPSQWARCQWDGALRRNRYANVDPYQANRVRLNVPDGQNDYINASPIELTASKSGTVLRYIATQGPKADTYSHFWRMVWHETSSPAVIVMLTKPFESDREKCFRYYPESLDQPDLRVNANDEYGDGFIHNLKLISLSDTEDDRAQIRELEMSTAPRERVPTTSSASSPSSSAPSSHSPTPVPDAQHTPEPSETRKIWHLLFGGWPDFQVPEGADRAALLALLHTSRAKTNHNLSNPRVVHCSAGVGRSGTFIALDWLLQELDEGSLDSVPDDMDPVASIVDTLRRQRTMMVQGEAQLGFIYDVVRERWRARWVDRFPEEAERLGVVAPPAVVITAPTAAVEAPSPALEMRTREDGPRLKRQKSVKDEASFSASGSEDGTAEGSTAASSRVDDVDEEGDDDADHEGDDDYDDARVHDYNDSGGGDGSLRAELEAELQDAQMEFERGKT